MPRQRELGLFAATATSAQTRGQPRDAQGRFVKVRYSAHRLRVLEKARQMRADMGLPPSPYLMPFGPDGLKQRSDRPDEMPADQPTTGQDTST
ncbi:MAG: hypothetical protein U0975_16265 [Erythrobacter sp.]|nr:hypothetical protein [Erythrobacter sp.]MDZ4274216.1 hypothetical protein [Erythrobacter sp.]